MPDENSAQILGQQRAVMLEEAAARVGIICINCAGEMSGTGFEFVSLRPVFDPDRGPIVREGHIFVCGRDGCAEAREKARSAATAVRPAGGWEMFQGASEGHDDDPSD